MGHLASDLAAYDDVIDTVRVHREAHNIHKWTMSMELDDRKVSRWISKKPCAMRVSIPLVTHNMHPQQRLSEESEPFVDLWQSDDIPLDEVIHEFIFLNRCC